MKDGERERRGMTRVGGWDGRGGWGEGWRTDGRGEGDGIRGDEVVEMTMMYLHDIHARAEDGEII